MEVNKILNECCLQTMAKMPDGFVDLTVTSPPYDNLRNYKGYSFPFEEIAKELFRVTKKGGIVVWVVGDSTVKGSETGTSFRQALFFKEIGFNLHDTMIYQKSAVFAYDPRNMRYKSCFEYMFVLSKGKPATYNPIIDKPNKRKGTCTAERGRTVSGELRKGSAFEMNPMQARHNIWMYNAQFNSGTKDKIAFKHPAIMPEKLAADHIVSWSNEGGLIYDPFMGSGTTAKMAKLNNRLFIGSEMSEEYCAIAEERLALL